MQKMLPTAGDMAKNTESVHWSWRFPLVIFLCYVVACKNVKCSAPSKMLMLMQAPNSDWTPTTYKRQNQGYQNFPFLPQKLGFLAQKRPNLAQNMLSWAHIDRVGSFGALLVGGCGARAGKLFLPPTKIRIFGLKKAKFGKKYAFLGTYRPCRFIWCPVGWWLWRAGCISQDTHLL